LNVLIFLLKLCQSFIQSVHCVGASTLNTPSIQFCLGFTGKERVMLRRV